MPTHRIEVYVDPEIKKTLNRVTENLEKVQWLLEENAELIRECVFQRLPEGIKGPLRVS